MQFSYVPLRMAAALALCLATASCAAPSHDGQFAAPVPEPEIEEPLTLSVDALDVRHGSLRIEASMTDGSADVSMWLGGDCGTHEVGRGIATRSGFAWSLSRDEIARAIECGLVVHVHAVDPDGHRVRRTAELPVSASLESDGAENVRLFRQESEGASTKMTFLGNANARRLHVAGTVIGVETEEYRGRLPRNVFASTFIVGNDDLARSMLARRHVSLLGEHFLATITVGSMTLDVSEPAPEPEPVIVESSGDG
jgi:hypothetical protein